MKFYHVTSYKAWKAIKKEGVLFGVHGNGGWDKLNQEKTPDRNGYGYTYLSPCPLLSFGIVVLQINFTPERDQFGTIHNYGFDPPPGQICTQFSVFRPIPLSDVKFCFWLSVKAVFIHKYWKIRTHPFVEKIIDILTRCPECKGEGGYTEVITDEGQGPRYPCGFCKKGYMNTFKKIYWLIVLASYKKVMKKEASNPTP